MRLNDRFQEKLAFGWNFQTILCRRIVHDMKVYGIRFITRVEQRERRLLCSVFIGGLCLASDSYLEKEMRARKSCGNGSNSVFLKVALSWLWLVNTR